MLGDPNTPSDWFEARTQTVVRALLALILVGAYIVFIALDVTVPTGFDLLVGAATGFFLGGAIAARKS